MAAECDTTRRVSGEGTASASPKHLLQGMLSQFTLQFVQQCSSVFHINLNYVIMHNAGLSASEAVC